MIVDQELVRAAEDVLRERFPDGPGRATAAYSREGRLYTGASAEGAADEPESAPIREATERRELLTALVTVAWRGPDSAVTVQKPAIASLSSLHAQARLHAQIATGTESGHVVVRPLWELVGDIPPEQSANPALTRGKYRAGMKTIGPALAGLAKDVGVRRAREAFAERLIAALGHEALRRNARAPSFDGPRFLQPTQLESVTLRHVWLAFELASEKFAFDVVDAIAPKLAELGCNDADVLHVRQGLEALRNVFSVLVVFVGTGREVPNEGPFNPYWAATLTEGVPIHRYLAFERAAAESTSARNTALLGRLIAVLSSRTEGGFSSYLRQRDVFRMNVFGGNGTGHCPFAVMSVEMLLETGRALERALAEGLVLLEPDRPEGT